MTRKIMTSLLVIAVTATMVGMGTFAYFSDTETSKGNTLTAGSLDLWVNNLQLDKINNPPVVTLTDLKPCETQYKTVTLHVTGNDADGWIEFNGAVGSGGTHPESEEAEDPGDTKNNIEDYIHVDIGGSWIGTLGSLDDGDVKTALGRLTKCTPADITLSFHLDKDVTNWAQGDVCTFEIIFGAEQVK